MFRFLHLRRWGSPGSAPFSTTDDIAQQLLAMEARLSAQIDVLNQQFNAISNQYDQLADITARLIAAITNSQPPLATGSELDALVSQANALLTKGDTIIATGNNALGAMPTA